MHKPAMTKMKGFKKNTPQASIVETPMYRVSQTKHIAQKRRHK